MALKLTLRPHERMIIGGAVVKNGNKAADLFVENNVSILRARNILSEGEANSPCRQIYFIIQLMYIDTGDLQEYRNVYRGLIQEVIKAAPSTLNLIERINESVRSSQYYQALKVARKLIDYEEELLNYVHESV